MGIFIAILIILLWAAHLFYMLEYVNVDFNSIFTYLHIVFQAYLYTGLFITGHDAMHGSISQRANINKLFGRAAAFLFAALSYKKLLKNHISHHKHSGTESDPDFNVKSQSFLKWWGTFVFRYLTIGQLIVMGVLFNILKIRYDEASLIIFWILPSVLSTFQLFYFGTYRPHKLPHTEDMGRHRARSQKPNHLWAMLSCYFFGYHHEHHDSPAVPWWRLHKLK